MQDEWGEMSETEQRQQDTGLIQGIEYDDGDVRKGSIVQERSRKRQWERCSTPLARADPEKLPDVLGLLIEFLLFIVINKHTVPPPSGASALGYSLMANGCQWSY